MVFSRPNVKHLSRQDLRSLFSDRNSSRVVQSEIHFQPNRVSPRTIDSRVKTNRSSTTSGKYRKQSLFRRVCWFFTGGIVLVLVLAAIVAIILLLIPIHSTSDTTTVSTGFTTNAASITSGSQSNTSSQNTNITDTTTSSTSSTSSTSAISTNTATSSTTSTSITSLMLLWNATGVTVAGAAGATSTAANQLDRPFSIALDSSNTLYIADQQNNRVQKWLLGASNGTTIAGQSSGTPGTNLSDFDQPSGILLDSSDNIYVSDTNNNRVQFWLNGASLGSTVAGILGSAGSANNELIDPYGIARDPISGTLYIVDQSNNRVMSYLFGASSGTVVAGGNGQGTANNQLYFPLGLYLDSVTNSLIIANAGGNNIVRWVLGATNWTLVAGSITGINGNASTLLDYPMGVTLDSMGNVYVADRNNHRIQLFLAGQSNGTTIAGVTGQQGANATLLYNPCSVALDTQLNLYVADTYNSRVQQFKRY